MTQTEWLVWWWRLVRENPDDKYALLKYANSSRGRNEPMPRTTLKLVRNEFITDHVVRKKHRMADKCFFM